MFQFEIILSSFSNITYNRGTKLNQETEFKFRIGPHLWVRTELLGLIKYSLLKHSNVHTLWNVVLVRHSYEFCGNPDTFSVYMAYLTSYLNLWNQRSLEEEEESYGKALNWGSMPIGAQGQCGKKSEAESNDYIVMLSSSALFPDCYCFPRSSLIYNLQM